MAEIGSKIHDKLLTDFATLTFTGGATCFNSVKKFYTASSWGPRDCVVLPDSTPEEVIGPSAGNTQTTRIYTFRAVVYEQIEAAASDSAGSIKYQRLLNIQDALLNYLQKEPSNLNSWGSTNSIAIYKIRVNQPRFDTFETEGGWGAILDLNFSIFLNIIPQNL